MLMNPNDKRVVIGRVVVVDELATCKWEKLEPAGVLFQFEEEVLATTVAPENPDPHHQRRSQRQRFPSTRLVIL